MRWKNVCLTMGLLWSVQVAFCQPGLANGPFLEVRQIDPATVHLRWPNTNGTFVPETILHLAASNLWQTVPQGPRLEANQFTLTLPLTNSQQFFRLRQVATNALPPDPGSVAPPLNQSQATVASDVATILHTGTNASQTGVASNSIVPRQAGVLRGRVLDRGGAALPGAEITVLDHPELGHTWSRLDGRFDLAVNAGGTVTLLYRKTDFIPAQRQATAPWQDFADLPDVVLLSHDPQVTGIVLSTNAPMQAAQGRVVSDGDGMRRATLLVPPGTEASIVMAGGTLQPVTNLHFRATEYTFGTNGPRAMPAYLPPQVGYTYCVELTTDEAQAIGTKVAGKDVIFSQPVPFYVENFLNFPVGSPVPVGYYDNDRGVWVPEDNGRIIQILSVTDGKADLDVDGDHAADTGATLTELNITDAEREKLAALYPVGQSLWRVRLPHLSTVDCNWPPRWPRDADQPRTPKSRRDAANSAKQPVDPNACGLADKSVISIQDQVLGESIALAGTPYRLHYSSDRVPGHVAANTLNVSVSGDALPASLRRIEVEVRVAGRLITQTLPPQTNQTYRFVWDGRNAYGQSVQGRQAVSVSVGYVYPTFYQLPAAQRRSFGFAGDGTDLSIGRDEITRWQQWPDTLGRWDGRASGSGAWTLNVHHAYDPATRVLHLGNGTRRVADSMAIVQTVAGGNDAAYPLGDGQPATSAYLSRPHGVAVASGGSFYIADYSNGRVRRVGTDGIIQTIAGGGSPPEGVGDGLSATNARLQNPTAVALAADGSLYISDYGGCRVRRVGTDGIIRTIAGTGTPGFNGESGPATNMMLNLPNGIALAADGSLYVADSSNGRVRCVAPDGTLATVAGGGALGPGGSVGDDGPARQAFLSGPTDVAVAPDGTLYIADAGVRRVDATGRITTFAGGPPNRYWDEGQPAVGMSLNIYSVAFGPDGNLYVGDDWTGIGYISPDGLWHMFAGEWFAGNAGFRGDGGPARQALFWRTHRLAFGPDGALYVSDAPNRRVRVVRSPFPAFGAGDIAVASEDGREVYRFDPRGRHLSTLDAITGATLLTFDYTPSGWLAAVEDGDHNRTMIERAAAGAPTAIVAPFGQRTVLELNPDGYLGRVQDPASAAWQLTYTNAGLLSALTDPRTNRFEFAYDEQGLLVRDAQASCCFTELSRSQTTNAFTVAVASGEGRRSSYELRYLPSGGQFRVNTFADGTHSELLVAPDATHFLTNADGSVSVEQAGADPRFSMQAPFVRSNRFTTPAGLVSVMSAERQADLTNAANLFSLRSLTNSVTVNGRTSTTRYEAATRTFTGTTPEGRQTMTTVDAQARPTQLQMPGVETVQMSYDSHGRPAQTAQGTRQSSLSYDPVTGYLQAATNALGEVTTYRRDAVGRVTTLTLPDASNWAHAWDAKDNLTMLTEPNGTNHHQFTYTPQNLMEAYRSPLGATETFTYNKDKELIRRQFPSSQALQWNYATNGQLASLQTPEGDHTFTYHATNGLLARATSRDGQQVDFAYDGSLLTSATWSGGVTGAVRYTYNNDFRVTQLAYAGLSLPLGYDRDGLLTNAGPISLTYNRTNSFLERIADGAFTIAYQRNEFGEITNTVASQGAELCRVDRSYDALGRIVRKVETIASTTVTWGYAYDTVGQLVEVKRDDVTVEAYAYDAVGNRIGMSNTLTGETLTAADYHYDADNKLLQAGVRSFTYDADGRVQTARLPGVVTTYHYNTDGTLAGVDLPGGKQITYLHDSRGRRIARAVNGVRTHAWLYGEGLMPLAEYAGNGVLRTTFIYGGQWTPVAFIRNGTTNHIVTDQLGSPRLVVDASGVVIKRVDYDAFGSVVLDTAPALALPFGFAGGMADPDHELTRFGARDYQPPTGRWTAKDPVLILGGLNLNGYMDNDPINGTDRNGLRGRSGCLKGNPPKEKPLKPEDFDVFAAWRLEQEAIRRAEKAEQESYEQIHDYWRRPDKKRPKLTLPEDVEVFSSPIPDNWTGTTVR